MQGGQLVREGKSEGENLMGESETRSEPVGEEVSSAGGGGTASRLRISRAVWHQTRSRTLRGGALTERKLTARKGRAVEAGGKKDRG
jgi:hypothetical protein